MVNFAQNNYVLGDWILSELLKSKVDSVSASLLAQVILSQDTKSRNRASLLHNTIFEKLEESFTKKGKSGKFNLDDSLSLMIEVYSDCINKIETKIKNSETQN